MEQFESNMQGTQKQLRQQSNFASSRDVLQPKNDAQAGHVLVVDDNEMNRDMLSRRLIRQGHTTEFAVNGRQALEMIKTQRFDLILLDIMMPEMNGYEVLEHLKADTTIPYVPVIMISAVDEIDSLVRCIELGAEDYLPKPFNRVILKARISASLEKKRLRDHQEAYIRQLDIENQRKSNELEQARQIQLSMLPTSPPTLPHLDIAARQETASEVGGDYYDFFFQPNGRLLMAVGDATGHGVGSGLMVSMTKASLLATNETDLVVLVRKINNILNQVDLGLQLNMALLLLEVSEVQDGVVTIRACGGGMPPIYILRAAGSFEEFLISNLPFGIIDEMTYELTEFQLCAGDTMILASDGLSERFNQNQEILGFNRLDAALANMDVSTMTATEVLAQVARIGDNWAEGQPLEDDVTLVVMRVN
jgi:sigma-B regulation protein RsbU (phosphoserine phosphatase)